MPAMKIAPTIGISMTTIELAANQRNPFMHQTQKTQEKSERRTAPRVPRWLPGGSCEPNRHRAISAPEIQKVVPSSQFEGTAYVEKCFVGGWPQLRWGMGVVPGSRVIPVIQGEPSTPLYLVHGQSPNPSMCA